MKSPSQISKDLMFCSGAILIWALMVAGCAAPELKPIPTVERDRPAKAETWPAQRPHGKPYRVKGKTYRPLKNASGFVQEGWASWYGKKFHGRLTASQEVYNMNALTAAHKILPFHTRVKVINLDNGREVVVRINDRGPFVKGRIIDLSYRAAQELRMLKHGIARVRLSVLTSSSGKKTRDWTGKVYTVQLGVFKNQGNARQAAHQIEDSRIQTFNREEIQRHRVLAGSFPTFEEAVERMEEIQGQGAKDAFIIAES